ncbi:hypothetical protein [Raineya sp.]
MSKFWINILGIVSLLFGCKDNRYKVIASYKDGKDILEFKLYSETSWGVKYEAIMCFFNKRRVDYLGFLKGIEGGYAKTFPVQEKHRLLIKKYIKIKHSADTKGLIPWFIWVTPDDFKEFEYEKIAHLISTNSDDILQKLVDSGENIYIRTVAYFDFDQLKPDTFLLKKPDFLGVVQIIPQGLVSFDKEEGSRKIGTMIGKLDRTGKILIMDPNFNFSGDFINPDEVLLAKNNKGQMLKDCFIIEFESPNPNNQN